jgi:steroid delta-isomerase-like uncharacterized protein
MENQLDANKQVVLTYVNAFNDGDFETLRSIFAQDAVVQGVMGRGTMDKALAIWRMLHESLQCHLTVEEMVAEGNQVAVRYLERGTFVGSFRGHLPTGKPYELIAMEWFVIRDGKIVQRWGARDGESQARQIGLPLT